ncbi:hypothetical protein K501DRAFT_274815 [Backusella circina FSU 941]|nr:hypothetical protein K501DRAFT_274815 [Backusella circina FSU 941]
MFESKPQITDTANVVKNMTGKVRVISKGKSLQQRNNLYGKNGLRYTFFKSTVGCTLQNYTSNSSMKCLHKIKPAPEYIIKMPWGWSDLHNTGVTFLLFHWSTSFCIIFFLVSDWSTSFCIIFSLLVIDPHHLHFFPIYSPSTCEPHLFLLFRKVYLVRFLCSVPLVAFFNVGSVPSFCARLPPPPPAHLLDAGASSFSPPSGSPPPPVCPWDAGALSFSPPPSCPVPPPSLWGPSCHATESASRWSASATGTSLQLEVMDSTPFNSFVNWLEMSDGWHEASVIAIAVLIGVAAIIALQQCLGGSGSRAPASQPSVLPPLVLPPPPPPYVPEPCAPSRLSVPSLASPSSRRPRPSLPSSQPTPIPAPASAVMERLAARAAPARQVAGSRPVAGLFSCFDVTSCYFLQNLITSTCHAIGMSELRVKKWFNASIIPLDLKLCLAKGSCFIPGGVEPLLSLGRQALPVFG